MQRNRFDTTGRPNIVPIELGLVERQKPGIVDRLMFVALLPVFAVYLGLELAGSAMDAIKRRVQRPRAKQ